MLDQLGGIAIAADDIQWLMTPKNFKDTLIDRILAAQQVIYIAALYLEDDEAGREVLEALLTAKARRPQLDIKVLVDFHRARRGLIGHKGDGGNYRLYRQLMSKAAQPFTIYGVPVKSREFLGVLHLKGFVIDDAVIYSGASLNNVYLQQHERYRLDRYYLLESKELACSMRNMIDEFILSHSAVVSLSDNNDRVPERHELRSFKQQLSSGYYRFNAQYSPLRITPMVGLGRKQNPLNNTVLQMVKESRHSLFVCTPYFNPPYLLMRAIAKHLHDGKRLDIVVGDKTANDFFIPDDQPFSTIGALPYLYEQSLRKFAKRQQWAIDKGLLKIHLWSHERNSFHLKGISMDERKHLLTGSNLNPRAWALDLENGLLLHDEQQTLASKFQEEQQQLLRYTRQIKHYSQLETLQNYPAAVKKILTRIRRLRADFFLRRIL
ncbi:CDP-diacylglycerol--serine O-phosphatidyltransferase [Shewanella yunxiaonensis]|uniref:CDP-diacylglycerol--serine O-phosphatidyltransferase n=1 Tax=Shewanella yunxiaonensis TaxID=2829809 RepID=A0ABX7YYQ7_9GAMM|nr:CDP-diacylglycerol--serine O-phosphatidyltransferase [Shewanella yunxiaonensis]QUN07445.1 CDP-diacylglycerol--serine O-phosphatidyltransferase [Shewanella yunxiaonensis]